MQIDGSCTYNLYRYSYIGSSLTFIYRLGMLSIIVWGDMIKQRFSKCDLVWGHYNSPRPFLGFCKVKTNLTIRCYLSFFILFFSRVYDGVLQRRHDGDITTN